MSGLSPLKASHLFFQPLPPTHQPQPGKEIHGRYMLTIPWNRVSGWGQPKISGRQDLTFDPLSGVLQYAVTCFEGMKVRRLLRGCRCGQTGVDGGGVETFLEKDGVGWNVLNDGIEACRKCIVPDNEVVVDNLCYIH